MPRKNQQWAVGDVFVIPNADDRLSVGQIVGREADVLNSVSVALFVHRVARDRVQEALSVDLSERSAFSVIFATRDLLDNHTWRIVGQRPVLIPRVKLPWEHTRASGWIGAKVIGAGIVNDFSNAYFGLGPWDAYKDPAYFEKLLLSPDRKPSNLVFK